MIFIAGIFTAAAMLLFLLVISQRKMLKSVYFPILLFYVFLTVLGSAVEVVATTRETVDIGLKIRFLGVPFIPTLWYLCIREFCGLKFKSRYSVLFMMVVPLLLSGLAVTWETNRLLFTDVIFFDGGYMGHPRIVPGPLFPLRNLYQYGIDLLGLSTLLLYFRAGTPRFRKQIFLFAASALIPFSNTFIYMVRIGRFNIDITHYTLVVFMGVFTYCLYKFGVINQRDVIRDNVLHQLNEGILLFDHNGIYMDSNEAARKIFPDLREVALGTSLTEMDYLPFCTSVLDNCGASSEDASEFSREEDGFVETFALSFARLNIRGRTAGYGVILNNISLLKKTLSEVEEKSHRDPLTGLYNRGYLFGVGEKCCDRFRFSGITFCAVIFDIDHFKRVNDTYGHLFGDFVLKEMAAICSADLRQSDVLGRYGGEEFCLLLVDTPLEGALKKAESLRKRISDHIFQNGDVRMNITASFGVASRERHQPNEDFTNLLKRADENLYRAKQEGRNRVC